MIGSDRIRGKETMDGYYFNNMYITLYLSKIWYDFYFSSYRKYFLYLVFGLFTLSYCGPITDYRYAMCGRTQGQSFNGS